jgi:NADH dehydrogenase [ubiquinone] 1 alpha subcomplex assembly factor 6
LFKVSDIPFCQAEVQKFDRDRYLTALFAPTDRRPDLFALYAFNHEVAKVSSVVSEPMLGQIRLQWWREAIDEIYEGTPRSHQIVDALAVAIERHSLPRDLFDQLIDARELDLEGEASEILDDWLDYVAATSSNLTALALRILGVEEGPAHHAGHHVGIAWALTGLLRVAPERATRSQIFLPLELPDRTGALHRLDAVAWENLRLARALRADVPKAALPALLPATLATRYLRRLHRPTTGGASPLDQVLLYARALTGRY